MEERGEEGRVAFPSDRVQVEGPESSTESAALHGNPIITHCWSMHSFGQTLT
jgi:hypothetical protein